MWITPRSRTQASPKRGTQICWRVPAFPPSWAVPRPSSPLPSVNLPLAVICTYSWCHSGRSLAFSAIVHTWGASTLHHHCIRCYICNRWIKQSLNSRSVDSRAVGLQLVWPWPTVKTQRWSILRKQKFSKLIWVTLSILFSSGFIYFISFKNQVMAC